MINFFVKNRFKIISLILSLLLICIFAFQVNCLAADIKLKDEFNGEDLPVDSVKNTIEEVLFVFQVVGMGVATIMLVALAIKFIVSSPSERAEIKRHLVIYVLGAILIFAASGIAEIIKKFFLETANEMSV